MRSLCDSSPSFQTVQTCGAFALGYGILTLSSFLTVPMFPVPMTMQSLAVTLVGVLFGWRMGAATVTAWLASAAMGMPVLADGASGPALFLGPTAGYMFAFPLAAAVSGFLAISRHLLVTFWAMAMGNAVCLLGGAAWLTILIGPEEAVAVGVLPFLLGGVVKSAIGATAMKLIRP